MYHDPVLLEESVDALITDPGGVYVDCTFGGGGHSRILLERLNEKGRLVAFDRDEEASENQWEDHRLQLVRQNFRYIKNSLRYLEIKKVNGVLADLGVSSHQFDTPERGFSFRFEGPLDMRMSRESKTTAAQLLNESTEEELADIFFHYGELRNARKLAREIVHERKSNPIHTTGDLKKLFDYIPPNRQNKFLAQLFQSLRIEVNDELGALKDLLTQSGEIIEKDGRLVVISYHSLEDRLVKRYMKFGKFRGEPEKDIYGRWEAPFTPLQSKVIVPTEEEIKRNPRAKSAKMRIAVKN